MVSESVAVQQMLSRGTTERPAADNHDIEGLGVWVPGGTPQRFVQPVTNITPDHVLAEVRILSGRARHKWPPVSWTERFGQLGGAARCGLWCLPEARRGAITASDGM